MTWPLVYCLLKNVGVLNSTRCFSGTNKCGKKLTVDVVLKAGRFYHDVSSERVCGQTWSILTDATRLCVSSVFQNPTRWFRETQALTLCKTEGVGIRECTLLCV